MKLRNKLVKTVATDDTLRNKISLYSDYREPDASKTRYVLTDVTDIIICNGEDVEKYLSAGFTVFGSADSEEELQGILQLAEQS